MITEYDIVRCLLAAAAVDDHALCQLAALEAVVEDHRIRAPVRTVQHVGTGAVVMVLGKQHVTRHGSDGSNGGKQQQ